jgi:hypothetical protein
MGTRKGVMPTDPQPPTLAEVVHRAAGVCDPAGESEGISRLLAWFEDRDEPVTGIADIEAELAEARGAIDPAGDEPAVTMAIAVAAYLAHRRDEIADDREELLRLAARAEFEGDPPERVAEWLAAERVSL